MIEGWIAVKAYRRFHKFGRRHILTQVGNRRCAGVQGISEAGFVEGAMSLLNIAGRTTIPGEWANRQPT
jgi:hypothetical protein